MVMDPQLRVARQCVEAGARFMDERTPGWHECIDLKLFDIENAGECIFGQVYIEGFEGACELFGLGTDEVQKYGFESGWANFEGNYADYDSLKIEWRILIKRRQLTDGGLRTRERHQ